MKPHWSPAYYGLTHCGKLGDIRRCSVQRYKDFALLMCFSPGGVCKEKIFDTGEEAQNWGERWISGEVAL